MKKITQLIVDNKKGDCFRAAVASVLNLELDQVPHFVLYEGDKWHKLFIIFLEFMGYEYKHVSGHPSSLIIENSFEGFFLANVPSKTFQGYFHSVIINCKGMIVHDPNPNKAWEGLNILEDGGEHCSWYIVNKIDY